MFKKKIAFNSENDASQKNLEISDIEKNIDQKKEKLTEIEVEIEEKRTQLSKIEVLIKKEKKKLLKIEKKSENKSTEFQNLILEIWKKKDKHKDLIVEGSTVNQRNTLEKSLHLDKIELKYLFREMENYIDNAYLNSSDVYKSRIDSFKDIDSITLDFFRTKDRIDNCILIFQYLIFFGRDIEFPIPDIKELTKQYRQFKDTMICFFELIDENDVKIAIYREMIKDPSNVIKKKEDFDLRIKKMQEMIKKRIIKTDHISVENLFELFNIFREFMLFWFEIKNYDIKKIRKSDIYIYYLLKHLLSLNNSGS